VIILRYAVSAMAEPVNAPGVRDIHQKFESLFNAGDLDGLLGLYEPNAILNASAEAPARGTQAIRAALQGFLGTGGKISLKTIAVFETSDGIALIHGEWTVSGGSTDLAGKSAEVLRRQADGRWLYVIDNPSG